MNNADARRFLEVMGYDLSPYTKTHIISRDSRRLRLRRDVVHALLHFDPLEDLELDDE